ASAGWAETHTVYADRWWNSFHHRHPVLKRIRPGDSVVTRTIDATGLDEKGQQRTQGPNPLTGPFYIEGAQSGDAIVIRLDRIRMNRNFGWSRQRLGAYAVTPESMENTFQGNYREGAAVPGRSGLLPWDLDLQRATVRLREPASRAVKFEFPARPMLGCVGVAAPADFGPTSAISGTYGGNMDYNEVVEGATVILPVYHPGALLFIGDGHALQADGEPTGTGIETTMDVTFTVSLRKGANLPGPRLENAEFIAAIGSQPEFVSSLDRTLRVATSDMVHWLTTDYKIEPWAAHQLIGYQGKYDVITVGGSMALRIPRRALPPSSR
ncbi:MAG: acetamidase, partial [Acidobacteria bacterium]|nr:acetamidase [Acidobacteriota bacterium]